VGTRDPHKNPRTTEYSYIVAFLSTKETLEVVKGIASKFQKSDLDAYEAYEMIDSSLERFQRYRSTIEREFRDTYNEAVSLCDKVGGTVGMPRMVGKQAHRCNAPSENPEEYYRKNIQIPFLDHIIVEMNTRFSKEGRTCADIFYLIPAVITKKNDDELNEACKKLLFWSVDLPSPSSLKAEVKEWKYQWCLEDEKPKNLVECINKTDEDMFPNIHVLLKIGCTLPVGSAGAERPFSCLRRTKTYIRNRMGEERLSGLCLMNIHKDVSVNINDTITEFSLKNNRRMMLGPILYD
jgi:hypothetical protein